MLEQYNSLIKVTATLEDDLVTMQSELKHWWNASKLKSYQSSKWHQKKTLPTYGPRHYQMKHFKNIQVFS